MAKCLLAMGQGPYLGILQEPIERGTRICTGDGDNELSRSYGIGSRVMFCDVHDVVGQFPSRKRDEQPAPTPHSTFRSQAGS